VSADRTGTPADRRLFASIVTSIQVGLYIWQLEEGDDLDALRLVYANPASAIATGVPVEDAIGRTMREVFPQAGGERAAECAEVARGAEGRLMGDVTHRDESNSTRIYRLRAFPLPMQQVGLAFNDVTGERTAEGRALAMLESMSDGFYMLDPQMRFTFVNAQGAKLMGRAREQMLGRAMLEVFPEGKGQALYEGQVRALQGQVTVVLEELYEPWDRWFAMRFYPSPDGLAVYFQDVTARKQLEAQLLQSQKLEAVGHLAGGVAHDFNNLLTVIDGYTSRAQARIDPQATAAVSALSEVRAATARASALTAKLLAFSRKQPLNTSVASVSAIVESAMDMLAPLVGEDIVVHRELDPDAGRALVDVGLIEQVLVNLTVNARDAMVGGGNLWVSTGHATLQSDSESGAGDYAFARVRDDGCGMDEPTLAQIFDPFFTTKPIGEGTGLGLSTAFGTVRQAGGRLEVSSAPGAGTTFTVWLPRVEPEAANA
jgi:PAS domain S-box-containing protein